MRIVKIAGFVVAGLILLVAAALLAVRALVDPNAFKGPIEREVLQSTGRELQLAGDLKLALFPSIALQLGPASLGSPPGFGTEPFASIQRASLSVRLLPLLHRRLEIGHVEVDGLDLHLAKDARGRGNWQFAGPENAPSAAPPAGAASLGSLGGITVHEARVRYQEWSAEHLNLDIGKLASGLPVPVRLSLALQGAGGARPLALSARFDVQPDLDRQRYEFSGLQMEGTLGTRGGGGGAQAGGPAPVPWSLSLPALSVDVQGQTAAAGQFAAEFAGLRLTGRVQGEHIIDAPSFHGSFALAPFAPRQVLPTLGFTPPAMRDAHAFSRLSGSGNFDYGSNALRLQQLTARLDDSTVRGSCAVTNLDTDAVAFDLSVDRIDLDRYRAPPAAVQGAPSSAGSRPASTPLPTDALRSLHLDGSLAIGQATIAALHLAQVRVGLHAGGGVLHVAPASAQLYGGSFAGDITLDAHGAVPALTTQQRLSGVDVASLLQDFAKVRRLSGRGNLSARLAAHGRTSDEMLASLSGTASANLEQGAVEGVDLWFQVNRALALIQKQSLTAGSDSGRTRFDEFKASATLADGVANTRDLSIVSQNLRVAGQGSANLVTDALNLQIRATLMKSAGAAPGGTLAEIPLAVSGTFAAPQVRPDLEGMAKARLQQEIDRHKQDLQQQLQNQLQKLFGR